MDLAKIMEKGIANGTIESRIEDAVWKALEAGWTPEQIRRAVVFAIRDYEEG